MSSHIGMFLSFVGTTCSILSLTNYKFNLSNFFNSLNFPGKVYLVLIFGGMLTVLVFFYVISVKENLETELKKCIDKKQKLKEKKNKIINEERKTIEELRAKIK